MTRPVLSAPERDINASLVAATEDVLASEEFDTAIQDLGLSPEDLRSTVRSHANQLLSHPALADPNDPRLRKQRVEHRWGTLAMWIGIAFLVALASTGSTWTRVAWAMASLVVAVVASVVLLFRRSEQLDVFRLEVLEPFLREQITLLATAYRYSDRLPVRLAPNLGELSRRTDFVLTPAARQVERIVGSVPSANVGIAGPRGVGKTAILHRYCRPSLAGEDVHELRVMVSAPVDYAARDFIIHLFARLCEEVLSHRKSYSWKARAASTLAAMSLGIVPALIVAVGLAMAVNARAHWPVRRLIAVVQREAAMHALVGSAVAVFGMILLILMRRHLPTRLMRLRRSDRMTERAKAHLRRLRFLQSVTRGRTASVSVAPKILIGGSSSQQFTEMQSTLPELVEEYRDFATDLSIWWRSRNGGRGGLIVGIDELDKIATSEAAERFLNDLKSVFGVPYCYYFVSVSDEALESFEQRGFLSKTVYDSAFDEVIRVSPLSLVEARLLVQRRVAGMPEPFVALCHVLSSGLPRDLLRTVRTLLELAGDDETPSTLAQLSKKFVSHDLRLIKRAVLLSHARGREHMPAAGMVDLLLDETWPGVEPREILLTLVDGLLGETKEMMQLAAAVYFGATVVEVFGRPIEQIASALRANDSVFDQLASIRSAISLNPELGWELTTQFRASYGLIVIPFPQRANAT